MRSAHQFLESKLNERRLAGNYRELRQSNGLVDFCSNDYLGFAHSAQLKSNIAEEIERSDLSLNGATGSRLLAGNSAYAENLEQEIAALHDSEAGLIFNSGYDANVGLFSSVPQRGDTIITDELIHASIIDGARLSHANRYIFKHNSLESLEEKLKNAKGNCYVVIESVYSMDGDTPPIADILNLTQKHNGNLIIDEAHAIGIFGLGIVNELDLQRKIFARVVTFGKALGCHGAIILGSDLLRNYLINFARSFIYTTAPAPHQLASIKMAYRLLVHSAGKAELLKKNIAHFKEKINQNSDYPLIESYSAIQCLIFKSNDKARDVSAALQSVGLDVRAILSPTVPVGSERIRICLHSFNTQEQIALLADTLNKIMNAA